MDEQQKEIRSDFFSTIWEKIKAVYNDTLYAKADANTKAMIDNQEAGGTTADIIGNTFKQYAGNPIKNATGAISGEIASTLGALAKQYWYILAGALVALIVVNRN